MPRQIRIAGIEPDRILVDPAADRRGGLLLVIIPRIRGGARG